MIFDLLRTFLSWSLILPSAFLTGSFFASIVNSKSLMLRGIVYYALGLACLSYSVVLLSAFQLLNVFAIWTILIGLIIVRFHILQEWIHWLKAMISDFKWEGQWPSRILTLFFVISFFALLAGVLSPEIGGDALTYQLNLPKLFLEKGSVAPEYYDLNSYFPMFMNNLYLIGLATGGTISAKFFHFFCGFLLFIAIKSVLFEETGNPFLAHFFALVCWITPTIYNLLSTTYVDVALAFYVFLALLSLNEACRQLNSKLFLLCGLFTGFAISIKYIALVSVVGLLGLWLIYVIGERFNNAHRYTFGLICWLLGVFLGSAYWLIRNWYLTGNPVFPYLATWFGTEPVAGTTYHLYGVGKSFFDFISIFWNMFYTPSAFGSFGSRTGIFYFLLLPFFLIASFVNVSARRYVFFSLFFLLAWFYVCQAHRYVLPVLPAVSIAGGIGVHWCYATASLTVERLIKYVLSGAGLILLGLYVLGGLFHYRYSYLLFLGVWTSDEYLLKMERTIPIARWIDRELPQEVKILIESEPRQFYFKRRIIRDVFLRYRTGYDRQEWDPLSLKNFLQSFGITHLLISDPVRSQGEVGRERKLQPLLESALAHKLHTVRSQNIRDDQFVYQLYGLN